MAELNKQLVEDISKAIEKLNEDLIALDATYSKMLTSVNNANTSFQKKAATSKTLTDAERLLKEEEKKLIAAEKEAEKAAQALDKQRQKGLQAMAKAEQKERDLQAAINKEVKSEQDLIEKNKALITVRRRLDTTTDSGKQKHKELTAEINKNTTALKKSDAQIGNNQRNVGNYKSALQGLKLAYVAVAAAIAAAVRVVTDWVKAADKQQKAEAKLLTALKGREDVQKRLLIQATQLQGVTLFGDEETINAQAYLAAMGLNERAIKRLIPLVQDLATKNGTDLKTSADLIAKSVGSSTNALSRYGITVTGAVGSSERLESAIEGLNKQVGGQSVAAANAGAGAVVQFNNAWGDLKETLGAGLLPTINKLFRNLTSALKTASQIRSEVFAASLSEQEELDIKEFKSYIARLKERGVKVDDLAATTERFLDVDRKRLALLKEDEDANKTQIAIVETRIRAIEDYTDTQINGINLVLDETVNAEETKKTAIELTTKARQDNLDAILKAYREHKEEIQIVDEEALDAELAQIEEDAQIQAIRDKLREDETKQIEDLEARKRAAKFATLDAIREIFGQETLIGKAALAIQKADAIQQNLISLGIIGAKNAEAQAKSAAAAPFPFNIPLIAGTIAQFVGIINLFKKSKKYKEGTKGKHDTPDTFVTSEKGAGVEWIENKGKLIQTDKPTLFTGMAGSRVYSNPEVQAIIGAQTPTNDFSELIKTGKDTVKAVKNIKTFIVDSDRKIYGFKQGNYKRTYL